MRNGTFWLAIFVVGCASSPPVSGNACTRASDCAAPLSCQLGRCRASCASARDCPAGMRCLAGGIGGVCSLADEASCGTCAAPLQCATECRTPCILDGDCFAGTCASGTCLEPISGVDAGPRDAGADVSDAMIDAGDAGTDAFVDVDEASDDADIDAASDDANVDAFVDVDASDAGLDASSDGGCDGC